MQENLAKRFVGWLATSVFARGKERIQLSPSIVAPVVKLTDEGPNHALKRLLGCIVEVEVEIEETLMGKGPPKIFNDCGAKNRLATSRNTT
jgi:hypothetical protein